MAEQKGAYMSRHVKDATGKLGRMRKQLLEARKEAKAAKALFAEADRRNMLLQTENAKLDKVKKEHFSSWRFVFIYFSLVSGSEGAAASN